MTESENGFQFYVALTGDDANPGTKDSPFLTIHRAQSALRNAMNRTSRPMRVFLRGGTYYLNEPIVFTPEDSGERDRRITYSPFPGERVTISGGRKIEGEWDSYRDGIMVCSLPEAATGELDFTQLFVNGKRQIRARYPNFDPNDPIKGGYIFAKGRLSEEFDKEKATGMAWIRRRTRGPRGVLFDPKTFTKNRIKRPEEAVIHIFPSNKNANLQWRIKDIDWNKNIIWLGWGGFQRNTKMFPHGYDDISENSMFFIENSFEELDAPGEWYLDKGQGKLYYLPEEGVDLSTADVIAPVLKQVVEFKGSQDKPVVDITFSGFTIAHTTSTFLEPYEVLSGGD